MDRSRKEPEVEVWDDGDFDGIDNFHIRNASSTTQASIQSRARESLGSRLSVKSDQDEEGDWQLLLANDDELSTKNAIDNAKKRGINLPANLPASALLGGTITKFGSSKPKKSSKLLPTTDWDDDFEPPATGNLKLKLGDGKEFPDSLRHVSGGSSTTSSPLKGKSFAERMHGPGLPNVLNKYKDDEEDIFGDIATIKVTKSRAPRTIPNFELPNQLKIPKDEDAFETDFELPPSGQLKLSSRSHTPKTPGSQVFDDLDQDWAEGSHGSFGSVNTSASGIRRAGKSARSSSISARSPSIFSPTLSSCLTAESEDEGLDCFVLPTGPLNLGDALKKRVQTTDAAIDFEPVKTDPRNTGEDDMLEGLELGPGPVFDANKLTLNRNIQQRAIRQTSPPRRPATSLTFTNKPPAANTRIPKPASGAERPRSKLEPVFESGGPISHYRSNASRIGTHAQQASISSVPVSTSTTQPALVPPSTPSRRGLAARTSRDMLRPDSAQNTYLKSKRSLPAMSSTLNSTSRAVPPSPARGQPMFPRPTSRQDRPLRPNLTSRPRTPVERAESSLAAARRPSAYAVPVSNQPRQLTKQGSRTFHRPNSSDDNNNNNNQPARPNSRLSERYRSNTPSTRRDLATKQLARIAATKKVTEPVRRRGYGDGTELDGFDDLPTSAVNEAKFTKIPAGTLKSNATRRPVSGISQASTVSFNRADAPSRMALSPTKTDNNVPSWARSTAASRQAREQRLGPASVAQSQRHPPGIDHHPASTINWKSVVNNKAVASPRHIRQPLPNKPPPRKPQLINNRGGPPFTKGDHGMQWNERLSRWDGNEAALAHFEQVPSSPKRALGTQHNPSPVTKPALIANFGATKGVQVVGGMVFDPARMMWVKMSAAVAKSSIATRQRSDSLTNTTTTDDAAIFDLDLNATSDDDEDPFAGIADLPDESSPLTQHKYNSTAGGVGKTRKSKLPGSGLTSPRSVSALGGSSDEDASMQQAEEFDVGPSFVKRQQAEEEKWRRRLKGWESLLGKTEDVVARRGELRELILAGMDTLVGK